MIASVLRNGVRFAWDPGGRHLLSAAVVQCPVASAKDPALSWQVTSFSVPNLQRASKMTIMTPEA
jgi:hypothetical protein